MTKKSEPDLKAIFKKAAEIAALVPESMQEAAFNKAVDLLTGGNENESREQEPKKTKQGSIKHKSVPNENKIQPIDQLLNSIDSTQYPEIGEAGKVLDRSLLVLKLALEDHDVDGLKATAISKILTNKFRISTTQNAVNMALSGASNLVNRIPDGQGFLYRIMEPGLKHLREAPADTGTIKKPNNRQRTNRKRKAKTSKLSEASPDTAKKAQAPSKKSTFKKPKSPQKIGLKAAIQSLIDSGFLTTPRTSPEIQTELSKKRGLTLNTDAISVALLRMLRDQLIERDENKEGQYEYQTSKS